ncbi:MAG: MMPL family transporter [Burkholderiales bacterium]
MSLRVALWAALLILCGWTAHRAQVKTDLTAFLPRAATPAQELLLQQLQHGVAGRLVLIAIEGTEPPVLARLSAALAANLRASGLFGVVDNGEGERFEKEREFLLRNRYLLSPAVSAKRFSVDELRRSLEENLSLLGSPAAAFVKDTLPRDPTNEFFEIVKQFGGERARAIQGGVWFSRDGKRALILAETLAPGSDLNAQHYAIDGIKQAFSAAAEAQGSAELLLTGPGVFAQEARTTIEAEAWRLALAATAIVVAILFSVYRDFLPVFLTALPALSGLVVGFAAVALGFGFVHGLTLGFGATLIGETVDYPTYVFTQRATSETLTETLRRIGPTLGLAVMTTVFGAFALLMSSFAGLSQLGLLTVAGVAAAGMVTRFVLPALARKPVTVRLIPARVIAALPIARRGAGVVWVLAAASLAVIAFKHDRLWDDDIANLSPVSEEMKRLDGQLRSEMGAPDVRHLIVFEGARREEALQRSEKKIAWLQSLVEREIVSAYEIAATILPSEKAQATRRAALPEKEMLESNLAQALAGLPFRQGLFAPFLADVAHAKEGDLIDAPDLAGSALALKVNSLLFEEGNRWYALAPLAGVLDPAQLARAVAEEKDVRLVDLKRESDEMVASYRAESLTYVAAGLALIAALLWLGLKSLGEAARVFAPVAAATAIALALLLLVGQRLTLFHLVSLLLVVGVGVNYALFFNRRGRDEDDGRRTLTSLVVCGATTVSAFGCLAFSATPVLSTIGSTVALGTALALFCAAALAPSPPA